MQRRFLILGIAAITACSIYGRQSGGGVTLSDIRSEMQRNVSATHERNVKSDPGATGESFVLNDPEVHVRFNDVEARELTASEKARPSTLQVDDRAGVAKPALPGMTAPKVTSVTRTKAPSLKTGHILTKEIYIDGSRLYSFRLSFERGIGDTVLVSNIYGLGETSYMKVNTETGAVNIPQQVIFTDKTYGNISILPLIFQNNQLYLTAGDLKGTINEKGVITLGTYGIVCTQTEIVDGVEKPTANYGKIFNVYKNAEWIPANAKVNVNVIAGTVTGNQEYGMLLEKTGDNEMTLYGLGNIDNSSQILRGRMTPAKKIQVSAQTIYNNMMYGKFCNYPAELTYDETQNKWKAKVDATSSMILATDANGNLAIPGWVISAAAAPSAYIGYAYKNMVITPMENISWPAPAVMDMTGKGTSADPFVITKPEHFDYIAETVANGDNFDGVHFAMGNDINMAAIAPTRFVIIGDMANRFAGEFDGRNHTISNLKIDSKGFYTGGMFGVLDSTAVVKNLNFDSSMISGFGDCIGLLAGMSYGRIENVNAIRSVVDGNGETCGGLTASATGSLNNCSFSGSVYSNGTCGAISGELVRGSIINCHAKANVIADGVANSSFTKMGGLVGTLLYSSMDKCWMSGTISDKLGYHAVGGLVAYSSNNTITNSFNTAVISAKRASFGTPSGGDGDTFTGGLLGSVTSTDMTDCYNSGTIIKNDLSEIVGGLVGYLAVGYSSTSGAPTQMINKSHIDNCINYGQILSSSENPSKGIWGKQFTSTVYTASTPEEECIFNCLFDQQLNGFKHEKYGRDTKELAGKLPTGFTTSAWSVETGKYPVLKNCGTDTQAQELASAPVLLRDIDNAAKVKVKFDFSASTNVSWELDYDPDNGETATETKALRRDGNTVYVKDVYSNSVVQALTADNWSIKLYRLSIVPKVFDGEGISEDPYQIKTAADFRKLDEAVGTYGQSHLGDFFAVVNDIDFNNDAAYFGVGAGTPFEFQGTLDGRNHSISGLNINANVLDENGQSTTNGKYRTGLFGTIGSEGSVKNLIISANNSFTFYEQGGPIAGLNCGLIVNCRNYAEVKSAGRYLGGIAGANYIGARIEDCYNAGNVYINSTYAGGITGLNMANATISRCQNDGCVRDKLIFPADKQISVNVVGGICGYNNGTILNSVNNGDASAFYQVGGITGVSSDYNMEGVVKGCINTAQVTCYQNSVERGGIIGRLQGTPAAEANYYDASINVNGGANNAGTKGITGLSTSELTAGSLLEGLDASLFDFSTDKYPSLKAFASEKATVALRSMFVKFAPKQMRTNVTTAVPLASVEGLSFSLKNNTAFSISGSTLNVTIPTGNELANDTLTAVLGDFNKVYSINALPVILKGAGVAEDPYLIETPADWNKLADFMEASAWEYEGNYFKITNDLDFANDSIRVIAVDGVNFMGNLDGGNHTVKNFVYENLNAVKTKLQGPNLYVGKKIGILGALGSAGVIRNLTVDGLYKCYSNAAGIVGEVYGCVENVTFKGTVQSMKSTVASGIANTVYQNGIIRNCVNEGNVISYSTYASGIAYEGQLNSLIENCINRGTLRGSGTLSGIVYITAGGIKGCVNDNSKWECTTANKGVSTLSGICNTLKANAWMEDCVNKTDFDIATGFATVGTSLYGIYNATTTRKATDADLSGGYIKNCRNEGNLTGGNNVYGIGNSLKSGWKVSDCSNTGNITAVNKSGYAAGLFNAVSEYSGGSATHTVDIARCYNAGDVSGKNAKIGGLAISAAKFSHFSDCYNTGNVTVTESTGLTTGGLIGQASGCRIERCFNAGDVTSTTNAVGGLVGYLANGDPSFDTGLYNCFNIGDVVSTYSGTNSNGNAGGIGGYLSTSTEAAPIHVINCYNTGNVTANKRVAGLFAGAFNPTPVVENCYNSGKITCLEADDSGRYYWSGTTFSNNYQTSDGIFLLNGHKNCFYDKTVNPGAQFRNVPNSGKTTAEMQALVISEDYITLSHGGYPVLKDHALADEAAAGSSLLLLNETAGDTHESITKAFGLIAPEGAVWTAVEIVEDTPSVPAARRNLNTRVTDKLTIEDGCALPNGNGKIILTCTYKNVTKNFLISVNGVDTGVGSIDASKDVKSVTYIDLNGQSTLNPVSGQVYIVRTVYNDGTINVAKKLVVK